MSEQEIENTLQRKGLNAPRLSPALVDANIADVEIVKHVSKSGQVLRWAVITTRSGFAVTGRPSASVSSENDDAEVGERVATANARSELWPLMGYALKEQLMHDAERAALIERGRADDDGMPSPGNALERMSDAEHARLGHEWHAESGRWLVPPATKPGDTVQVKVAPQVRTQE